MLGVLCYLYRAIFHCDRIYVFYQFFHLGVSVLFRQKFLQDAGTKTGEESEWFSAIADS